MKKKRFDYIVRVAMEEAYRTDLTNLMAADLQELLRLYKHRHELGGYPAVPSNHPLTKHIENLLEEYDTEDL